jgi:hypothetical protein
MYRFRVTAHHPIAGFFRLDEESRTMSLLDGVELTLAPRDARTLAQATRYHFEGRSFATDREPVERREWVVRRGLQHADLPCEVLDRYDRNLPG